AQPNDTKMRRQLADILSWKKDYQASLALFEELRQESPTDAEIPIRIAEVLLWSGAYEDALVRFHALLEAKFEQPQIWKSYADAAASAKKVGPAHNQMLIRIFRWTMSNDTNDPVLLARLAWPLYRAGEKAPAGELLDKALALNPKDPAARKELASVLQ